MGMWVEHFPLIKLVSDGLDLLLGQLELASCKVLLLVGCLLCLRDDAIVAREPPVQDHLRGRHVVLLRDSGDKRIGFDVISDRS